MKPGYIWNLAASVLPAPSDYVFNVWYDNEHIPGNIKFKETISISRYRILHYSDAASVKLYPTYLGNYEFKDEGAWSRWNASHEFAETMETLDKLYPQIWVSILWRVQYEAVKTWKNTSNISTINVVGINTPAKAQKRFDEWFDNKYMPQILKSKQLTGAARYKIMGARYFDVKSDTKIVVSDYPKAALMFYFPTVPAAEAFKDSREYCSAQLEWLHMLEDTNTEVKWLFQMEHQRTWGKVEPNLDWLKDI